MNTDYKEGIQLKADEIAEEKYGMEFYELNDALQYAVYNEAIEIYFDGSVEEE